MSHGDSHACDLVKGFEKILRSDKYYGVAHSHVDKGDLSVSSEDRNTLDVLKQKKKVIELLTEKELKTIGINKCIEVFGSEFIKKYKDTACDCWGDENGMFSYWIGLTDEPEPEELRICAGESQYKYHIHMLIDRNTGELEVISCKTPND